LLLFSLHLALKCLALAPNTSFGHIWVRWDRAHLTILLVRYLTSESAGAEQEEGFDTVDANRQLGLPDDAREYSSVLNILKDLDIKSIQLIVRFVPTCL
jgi:hypothetical protein